MAAYQKRMLTNENSRLGKVDLVAMLKKEQAWTSLPLETREHLYTLLPPPANNSEAPCDADVNPLENERLRPYIEAELRRWQEDLQEGRETKKWRAEAMQAGKDHVDGKFDEWKLKAREECWGKPAEEDAEELKEGVEGPEDVELKVNGTDAENAKDGGKEVKDSEGEGSEL